MFVHYVYPCTTEEACVLAGCFRTPAVARARGLVYHCSEDDWKRPLLTGDELNGRDGVIVALGKFDAMHRGHRSLAETASRLGGYPCLLSFWGMAEVLGLPPRKLLTADLDRPRVLTTWAPHCDGLNPVQRSIPFGSIRRLSPEDFVRVLAEDMQVTGIITGSNYRFGMFSTSCRPVSYCSVAQTVSLEPTSAASAGLPRITVTINVVFKSRLQEKNWLAITP